MISPGSYAPSDVSFVLDIIKEAEASKYGVEARVASEFKPTEEYVDLFWQAVSVNGDRLAQDVAKVAQSLNKKMSGSITLVTLLRAGTPTGVLLARALRYLGRDVVHYSISAVRNYGIDTAALDLIREKHGAETIVFVDGWTGKGFIATELEESIARYNAMRNDRISSDLVVLADLAGVATLAASADDYLIPFSMLLGTICGLVSGAFTNPRGENLNAVVSFDSLKNFDLSVTFVERLMIGVKFHLDSGATACNWGDQERKLAADTSSAFVQNCIELWGVERNSIKPGLCEVNRALLTRDVAMILAVKDKSVLQLDLSHIPILTTSKNVVVEIWPQMPYKAAILLEPRF
jgi:hypothetical protein